MNYKSLTIIALVLMATCIAVPVSAMWNNGNWVSEDKNNACDNVKFDPKTGVTSCYRDNNPVNEIKASENGNGGIAVGSIRAGYSTLSDTIYVRNVLQDKNGTPMVIKVNPDATFRIPSPDNGVLAPGEYEATLDNFNLPDETVKFTIAANQQGPTYIAFIGQAASAPTASVCQRSILKASYCGVTIPAVTHVEHHNAYYTVVPAQKICGWFGCYYNGNADKSSCNPYDFIIDGQKYDFQQYGKYIYTYHAAYDETIIDTPAVTGGCADVTSNVREALSQGYTRFLFDNSAPHHGIYDITTTTLLSSVDDPAVGIVKDVSITYTTCSGVEQTIQGKEYQVITLN